MEIYNINPIYKNLMDSRGVKTSFQNKNKNNWMKALISIFVLGLLMMSVGVPVYDGVLAMENNAVPYEFVNLGNLNVKTTSTSGMGDLIVFELWHWGHFPTINQLKNLLFKALASVGAGWLIDILGPVIYTFLSVFTGSIMAYGLSLSSVEFALQYAAATVSISIDPPTLVAIATALVAA